VADTWTWDEAACRARLVVAPDPPLSPWVTELRGAVAALDAARAEVGRLEADLCGLSGWVRAQSEIRSGRAGACPECDRLREMARGLSERVAAQSELLSRRAEGRP
jgi:hypothetical protein